jgi:hypothetical protein
MSETLIVPSCLVKNSFYLFEFTVSIESTCANETRSCAKLTVYFIADNIFIYTFVTKHGEKVLACTPTWQATSICPAHVLCSQTEIGYRDMSYYYIIYRADRGEFKWGHKSRHSSEATQR